MTSILSQPGVGVIDRLREALGDYDAIEPEEMFPAEGSRAAAGNRLASYVRDLLDVIDRPGQPRSAGQELGEIMRDLDRTSAAWVAAGYGLEGPEHEAREAVFDRLKEWNRQRGV